MSCYVFYLIVTQDFGFNIPSFYRFCRNFIELFCVREIFFCSRFYTLNNKNKNKIKEENTLDMYGFILKYKMQFDILDIFFSIFFKVKTFTSLSNVAIRSAFFTIGPNGTMSDREKKEHLLPRKDPAGNPHTSPLNEKTNVPFSSSRGACVAAGSARGTGERSRLLTSMYQELAY